MDEEAAIYRIALRTSVKLLFESQTHISRLLGNLQNHIRACDSFGADEQFIREAREFLDKLNLVLT